MNIFITHQCPIDCALYLDDKRIVKMVLETAQMLSTVLHLSDYTHPQLYKATHHLHPCVVWAHQDLAHYSWLLRHFNALCQEYSQRYGKVHKSSSLKSVFQAYLESQSTEKNSYELTPTTWPNCTGIYKSLPDRFLAYKLYLYSKWISDKRIPTWYGKTREKQELLGDIIEQELSTMTLEDLQLFYYCRRSEELCNGC